jgi:hypothetical protein
MLIGTLNGWLSFAVKGYWTLCVRVFRTVYAYYFRFPVIIDGNLTSDILKLQLLTVFRQEVDKKHKFHTN